MAPEIIEQAGASTASDIWCVRSSTLQKNSHLLEFLTTEKGPLNFGKLDRSVGCVVIELLSGKPPHYELTPMQALFRIVQDETPPIPPGVSEVCAYLSLALNLSVSIKADSLFLLTSGPCRPSRISSSSASRRTTA